jgi:2-acylglycerol O-acyltransferase 2
VAPGAGSSAEAAGRPAAWWQAFLMVLVSGVAWTASIPILMFALGGSLSPHFGWPCGIVIAVGMFSILVQVDQRIAAGTVLIVSFGSAALAGGLAPFLLAAMATGMTSLNGVRRSCPSMPRLVALQRRCYGSYARRSELRGDLQSIQCGRSFFACHPHGIFAVGWISNVIWGRTFHKLAGRCFYLIDNTLRNKGLFARVLCDAFEGPHGGFRDNRRHTIERLMERGESVAMTPGAFEEATLCQAGRDRVWVKKRKGFVKYCLRHGYRVHPVYTFGESDTYKTFGGLQDFRLRLNKLGIPTVVFWGLPWWPVAPRQDLDLLTYVGEPVEFPKIDAPSIEEVDKWHGKYVQALQNLFDKYKAEADRPDAILEVL